MAVNFASLNCNGFKSCEPQLDQLLSKCDILCLQELMLTKQECCILNNFRNDCYGYGVSPVDASLGIIRGRPRGGVGFIWKNRLDPLISIIDCDYDWLCGIKICDNRKEYYLLNVYLPYEYVDNRDEFMDCIAKLDVFVQNITSTFVTIVGDFNANISRQSVFGDILQKFCIDNNLNIMDKDDLPEDSYTYVSSAWGTTSWLDHVVCSSDAKYCTSNLEIVYGCILSDHHPILGKIDFAIMSESTEECCNLVNRRIQWDALPLNTITLYKGRTDVGFNNVTIPKGVKCMNSACQQCNHNTDIDILYEDICNVLDESSDLLKKGSCTDEKYNIRGWNDHVKELHKLSREAYLTWKHSGKPRYGVEYGIMKHTRSKFKQALKLCRKRKNCLIADKIANKLSNKNDRDFWREIKLHSNSKIKLPNNVGNAYGAANICEMWQEHYMTIFNSVNGSSCNELHADLCKEHYVFDNNMIVYPNEIEVIFNELSYNKSPGLDGITSEHLKFASERLPVLLSILFSAMLVHGFVPARMIKSVIVPIIKNKNIRIKEKDNYRPICLSSVFSKVAEKILYSRLHYWLSTTCNQFGFKPKHGTDICVFILKELLRYYTEHGSCMYVAYLDASKAFDRVNHTKLFAKLLKIGAPKWIIRVLCQWYSNQSLCIRWGSLLSKVFPVSNGVRQGGILSPLLFNAYMNDLSISLLKLPIGCCSGEIVVNHLMYADDIVLLAPSAKGMQKLLDVTYEHGTLNDIIFNSQKSQLMFFDTMKIGQVPNITLGESLLTVSTSYKYLGHVITNDLSDEADIEQKIRSLYIRCNVLLRQFYFCSEQVKNKLFSCYCSNVYLNSLWVKYRKATIQRFIVSYNNAFRILHSLPRRCSASHMFATSRVDSCKTRIRRSIYSLMNRLSASNNSIVRSIIHSDVHITSALHTSWLRALHSLNIR